MDGDFRQEMASRSPVSVVSCHLRSQGDQEPSCSAGSEGVYRELRMVGGSLGELSVGGAVGAWCGGRGTVLAARHPQHPRPLALRRIHLDRHPKLAQLLQHEILTTRQLQHPNVLPYYNTFINGLHLYIVTPLMSYGSCRDLIDRHFNEGLPEQACSIVLRDTLQALDYIHKKGYIHRGIKSSHVLVCSTGKVCLSGLRSAASLMVQGKRQKQLHALPPPTDNNESLLWLSPEVLEQNLRGYDEKSDIYSIGMLACELGNGIIPFATVPLTLMLTEKVRGHAPQLLDCTTYHKVMHDEDEEDSDMNDCDRSDSMQNENAQRITQIYSTRRLSNAFHQFTNMCLQREPTNRSTCSQLLNHAFFKSINKSDSLAQILYEAKPLEEDKDSLAEMALEEKMTDMEISPSCDWDF